MAGTVELIDDTSGGCRTKESSDKSAIASDTTSRPISCTPLRRPRQRIEANVLMFRGCPGCPRYERESGRVTTQGLVPCHPEPVINETDDLRGRQRIESFRWQCVDELTQAGTRQPMCQLGLPGKTI